MEFKVHRKRQFASIVVPFYIVFDDDIDNIKKAIEEKTLKEIIIQLNLIKLFCFIVIKNRLGY